MTQPTLDKLVNSGYNKGIKIFVFGGIRHVRKTSRQCVYYAI